MSRQNDGLNLKVMIIVVFLSSKKTPRKGQNAASFGHSNAENLRARHVSAAYGALTGFSPPPKKFLPTPLLGIIFTEGQL